MEHHASGLAKFLTWMFGLAKHPWGDFCHGEHLSILERYDHLLSSSMAALITVVLVLTINFRLARIPNTLQQAMEFIVNFLRGFVSDNIAHNPDRYVPLVGTLGFFVLLLTLYKRFTFSANRTW